MTRPRLLDLFCGAGGCSVGYHRAGFDVTGVDVEPQPRYPFEFHQADALTFPLDGFDAIHASPPCHDHSDLAVVTGPDGSGRLLAETRGRLEATAGPWVIENVPRAPMRADFVLCGCMFGLELPGGLQLVRKRWFETSWRGFDLRPGCCHSGPAVTVTGHVGRKWRGGPLITAGDRTAAMGIDWMSQDELAQAIPPAYTEYIGQALLGHLAAERAA